MNLSRNVIIHFLGKLVPALSNLLIMLAGIRFLGKEAFGKYNLMFTTVIIVSSLFVGWVQQSALRFLTGSGSVHLEEESFKYQKLGLWTSLCAGLVILFWGGLYFRLTPFEITVYVGFAILFSYLTVHLTILQSVFRSVRFAVTESLFYLLAVFFAVILMFPMEQRNFNVFFLAMTLALFVVFIVQLMATENKNKIVHIISRINNPSFIKKAFSFGFPLTVWMLISSLLNYLDRFIINQFYGYEEVGIYSFVYDFVFKVGGFLSLPVLLAYHPVISRAWNEKDFIKGRKLIRSAVQLEMIILSVTFLVVFSLHDLIFKSFFRLHEDSVPVIFIPVALSAGLWQMALLIQKPLEFNFRQKLMIYGILLSVFINVSLNLMMIPVWGYVTAAYNTLFSSLFYFIFVLFFSARELKKQIL